MSISALQVRTPHDLCVREQITIQKKTLVIASLAAALLVSGCAQGGGTNDALALLSPAVATSSLPNVADANTASADAATKMSLTPNLADVIEKARAERKGGRPGKAMTMLDAAAKTEKDNKALSKERGLLALELGQLKKAERLITSAMDDSAPDWRLMSALGSTFAAKGDQNAAQGQFSKALELAPNHPSILNNLALSFALEGRHKEAEELLRRASTGKNARIQSKQNLALLLGLDGNISEARRISRAALPENASESNISFLESLKRRSPKISRANEPEDNVQAATINANTNY